MLDKLQQDLKQAQLNRDEVKTGTLRLLLSEIHNLQIAKGQELSDQDILGVIQKEVKKRKEAAEGFRAGSREESAQKEEAERQVLEVYLPSQLSDEELTKIVEETIALSEVEGKEKPSLQDMGRIIRLVMERVKAQADGARVSGIVKQKLL